MYWTLYLYKRQHFCNERALQRKIIHLKAIEIQVAFWIPHNFLFMTSSVFTDQNATFWCLRLHKIFLTQTLRRLGVWVDFRPNYRNLTAFVLDGPTKVLWSEFTCRPIARLHWWTMMLEILIIHQIIPKERDHDNPTKGLKSRNFCQQLLSILCLTNYLVRLAIHKMLC